MENETCALTGRFPAIQLERWQQAMTVRYSCRAYTRPLTIAERADLEYIAHRYAMPGVRVVIADCKDDLFMPLPIVGRVRGARHAAVLIVDEAQPRAPIYAGIIGEALALEAASMGVCSCWLMSFFRKKLTVPLEHGERAAAIIALGGGEQGTQNKRRAPEHFALGDYTAWPQEAVKALENVRLAPTAVNRQGARLKLTGRTLSLSGHMTPLDMGICMLHAEAAFAGTRHRWEFSEEKGIAHLVREAAHDIV